MNRESRFDLDSNEERPSTDKPSDDRRNEEVADLFLNAFKKYRGILDVEFDETSPPKHLSSWIIGLPATIYAIKAPYIPWYLYLGAGFLYLFGCYFLIRRQDE